MLNPEDEHMKHLKRIACSLRTTALVCAFALVTAQAASAGALASLASSMQPGTFAELTGMNGWNNGSVLVPTEFGCTPGDYITQYAEKAGWDPVSDRVLFVGQSHGNCYGGRFVIYTEATNTWSIGPYPQGVCQSGSPSQPCFAHGYDHNTVDRLTGDAYYRHYNSLNFWRFRNGAWTTIAGPNAGRAQCCGAIEYFSDLGRLIFIDGDWGVWSWNPSTSAWTQLANTNAANNTPGLPNLPMISYNNYALYNPVEKVMLFGGGSNMYKMDATGRITTLRSPPVAVQVTRTVLSLDPVSGKYILLSGSSMYEYNVRTDTWAQLPTPVPSTLTAMLGVGDGLIQAPITEHGVIMFVKYNFTGSKVYLYKHSPYNYTVPVTPPGFTVN
jgi:hypothetical protein